MHIKGGVSGQVAIGNNILQIGSIHGGVVNVTMPEQKPRPQPRHTPVSIRPRPFPNLLDREAEISVATAALQSVPGLRRKLSQSAQGTGTPVEFHGQAGLGKTSLLRHLTHHPAATSFPDGVVYLSVHRQPVKDLLQLLFDAFYECDVPFKPTQGQIRQALQGKQALIALDDVELARDQVEALMDFAPSCAFLLGSPERHLWGEGRAIELQGLPPDDALALVERELGRFLTSEERSIAHSLCAALESHPLRILQATAMVREEGLTLAEVTNQVQTPTPAETLTVRMLASLPGPERRILAVLAALGNVSLHAEHLSALAELADIGPVLEGLQERGLVQAHSPRYSLTGPLGQVLRQEWNLTPLMERALIHFTTWAERHQQDLDHLLEEANVILRMLEWAAGTRRWSEVYRLGRAVESALALSGRWDAWAQVLQWALQAGRALSNRAAEAWTLHQLGTRALCLGDAATARASLVKALRLRKMLGDRAGAAVTRHNLSILLGPPSPPRGPSQPAQITTPVGPTASIASLLLTNAAAFLPLLLLALVGLAILLFGSQLPPIPSIKFVYTPTSIPVPTVTHTPTITPTPTPTISPTNTPSPTSTPTSTPTPTHTPSPTPTPWPCADSPPLHWQPYIVEWGDTLFSLTRLHGTTVQAATFYNCLQTTQVRAGQWLYLPPLPTPTPTITPSPTPTHTPSPSPTITLPPRLDMEGPQAPQLIAPQPGAEEFCEPGEEERRVRLEWNSVSDPSRILYYEIYLQALEREPRVYPARFSTEPTWEVSLPCNEVYLWRVRAVDGARNPGEWSEESLFLVLSDREGPPAPTLLEPEAGERIPCPTGEPVYVTLRWNPVRDRSGIARYDVEVQHLYYSSFSTTSILQVKGSQSQTTIKVECGDGYNWRVRAVDGAGNVGEWSQRWDLRILTMSESDQDAPPAPDVAKPGNQDSDRPANLSPCEQVVLRWEAVSDPSGIQGYLVSLQQYDYKGEQWENIGPYHIIYEISVDVTDWLSIEWEYRWNVLAIDNAGNRSDPSPWLYFTCRWYELIYP